VFAVQLEEPQRDVRRLGHHKAKRARSNLTVPASTMQY